MEQRLVSVVSSFLVDSVSVLGSSRALYKNVDVLVLDEATSALDERTEGSLLKAFNEIDTKATVIVVAHRLRAPLKDAIECWS